MKIITNDLICCVFFYYSERKKGSSMEPFISQFSHPRIQYKLNQHNQNNGEKKNWFEKIIFLMFFGIITNIKIFQYDLLSKYKIFIHCPTHSQHPIFQNLKWQRHKTVIVDFFSVLPEF